MIGSQCIILVVFMITTSFARVNTDQCKCINIIVLIIVRKINCVIIL